MNIELALTLLSFFLIAIIICDYFLIGNLKKQRQSAWDSYRELSNKYKELEIKRDGLLDQIRDLQWQIDNPPKYKKGDKVGDLIIVSYTFHKPTFTEIIIRGGAKLLAAFFFGDSKELNATRRECKDQLSSHYIYELTHTTSGNKETKTESELIELSNPKQ